MNLNTHLIYLKKYKLNVKVVNAKKLYFKNLKNVSDPEKKKKLLENYL